MILRYDNLLIIFREGFYFVGGAVRFWSGFDNWSVQDGARISVGWFTCTT